MDKKKVIRLAVGETPSDYVTVKYKDVNTNYYGVLPNHTCRDCNGSGYLCYLDKNKKQAVSFCHCIRKRLHKYFINEELNTKPVDYDVAATVEEQTAKLTKMIEGLTIEIDEVNLAHKRTGDLKRPEMDALVAKIKDLQNQANDLGKERESIESELEEIQSTIASLNRRSATLRESLRNKRADSLSIKQRKTIAENELENMKEELLRDRAGKLIKLHTRRDGLEARKARRIRDIIEKYERKTKRRSVLEC